MSIKNRYVRLATSGDSAALAELNKKFNGVERSPIDIEKSLKETNEIVAVAVKSEEVVGFACAQYFKSFCYPDLLGEITEMYVDENFRLLGLATHMIQFLEEELKSMGVTTVKVLTGDRNQKALKTYMKAGYIQEDDRILQKHLQDINL